MEYLFPQFLPYLSHLAPNKHRLLLISPLPPLALNNGIYLFSPFRPSRPLYILNNTVISPLPSIPPSLFPHSLPSLCAEQWCRRSVLCPTSSAAPWDPLQLASSPFSLGYSTVWHSRSHHGDTAPYAAIYSGRGGVGWQSVINLLHGLFPKALATYIHCMILNKLL